MKIVRIDGGLGNQMFCYAFALALREKLCEDVKIDTHRYKFFPNHNGFELGKIFKLSLKEANNRDLWRVTNVAYNPLMNSIFNHLPHRSTEFIEEYEKFYSQVFSLEGSRYYIGNWQCYKYFDSIKPLLHQEFSLKHQLDDMNKELLDLIRFDNEFVSVHVRRGDYLLDPKYRNICDLDYYVASIQYAKSYTSSNRTFLIFSNDIEWCKKELSPFLADSKYIMMNNNMGADSYKDLILMQNCQINIIANSSFSWWASYLNQNDDALVICPSKWINLPLQYQITLPTWKHID